MLNITQLSKEQIAKINKMLKASGQKHFDAKQLKAIKEPDVLGFTSLGGIKVRGDIYPLDADDNFVESLEYGDVEVEEAVALGGVWLIILQTCMDSTSIITLNAKYEPVKFYDDVRVRD